MNTADIVKSLYKHYRERGYLCLHELKPRQCSWSMTLCMKGANLDHSGGGELSMPSQNGSDGGE